MESARVEMSVGGVLVNGSHAANGATVNGVPDSSKTISEEQKGSGDGLHPLTNGATEKDALTTVSHLLQDSSENLLNMISTEFYLPMATLVSRSAQECWSDLLDLVERLAKIPVFAQMTAAGTLQTNDQSKANLDKKDALLYFANKHKAVFIKLLVLLQWSKRGEDVRKTIELNYWLVQRRAAFTEATMMIGQMMQDLAGSQVPNPDLETAAEVLALGKVSLLPDLGYLPRPPLSAKNVLHILRRLDSLLTLRLMLDEDIPRQMKRFRVHDGRVTFSVPDEFDVDLSLLDESSDSKFLMVDFRFSFSPAPLIPATFQDEIAFIVNSALEKDGLLGAYQYLHDLTLSYRISDLYKQAKDLSQGSWAGHIKVDMLRRTLIVQYWLKRPGLRSWLEIGIGSGRSKKLQSPEEPKLHIRWLKEGKPVDVRSSDIDCLRLPLEQIIRQVIARHISSVFDSIYDQLLLSPLYADAELEIEQSSSLTEPAACVLSTQLSKVDRLNSQIEPISGAIVLSPVSDRTNKVQSDLLRSKHVAEEFVGRISSLRIAIAETKAHNAICNSGWQHLPGLKLSASELESLFSRPVSRASFYRQHNWLPAWMLAITYSVHGDHWWLTRRSDSGTLESRLTQLLQSKPLHLEGHLTPAYLHRLADYTSGTIVLQSNAEYLGAQNYVYRLPSIPRFSVSYRMPTLRFEPRFGPEGITGSCLRKGTEFSFHGFDQATGKAVTIARANFTSDATNLKELASSHLDSLISISPRSKQVMVRNVSDTGTLVIEESISKLRYIDNIVACAATVKRSIHHTLQSLSLSTMSIKYKSDSQQDGVLAIHFATQKQGLRIEFLPADRNPHQHMVVYVAQMLTRPSQSLSKNLENVLALLQMTQPLMAYLSSIQRHDVQIDQTRTISDEADIVTVHVLPRHAASYALHYFSRSANFPRDISDSETPKKLLVRLEILPKQRGQKTLWVIRPAIEEFNSYTRPSFSSNGLRNKMREEIFSKQTSEWLRLDEGAAVSSDQPEKLLLKIHGCIVEWLQGVVKPVAAKEKQQENVVNGVTTSQTAKTTNASTTQRSRPTGNVNPPTRPNGTSNPGQRPRQGQNTPNISKHTTKKQEVITLD